MPPDQKRAYSLKSFCDAHDVGRSKIYEEISAGRLNSSNSGKRLTSSGSRQTKILPPPNLGLGGVPMKHWYAHPTSSVSEQLRRWTDAAGPKARLLAQELLRCP